MADPPNIAIGIDLGTTYSCVAVYQNKKVNIITNAEGNRTTPSEVAFRDDEILVGNGAKNQGNMNPKNSIFEVKRLIGKKFNDPEIQSDLKNFPFDVVSKNSKPVIEVEVDGSRKSYSPQDISSLVLKKMKETAERYLGREVKDAVITVPAYFNQSQKQATKDAAILAGLNVLQIISEPAAAAMAFGMEREIKKPLNVLIFDLGGGTFDVSVAKVIPSLVIDICSTTGDTHFGGSDFDQKMLDYFAKEFHRNNRIDITKNPKSMRKLRTACEVAKRSLSANLEETVVVDALSGDTDFFSKITRVKFEELCAELFPRILEPVRKALDDAKMDKMEIDEVVLVGGSARIPKIQKLLIEFFNGKPLNYSVNPDEAVAYGAAVQAAVLAGVKFASFDKVLLQDVTPLSLGTDVKGDEMAVLIPRNARIPVTKTRTFITSTENQTTVSVRVYEGEQTKCSENTEIGEFLLEDITPLPRGQAQIDVTFKIDKDGIFVVTAVEKSTGKSKSITIKSPA